MWNLVLFRSVLGSAASAGSCTTVGRRSMATAFPSVDNPFTMKQQADCKVLFFSFQNTFYYIIGKHFTATL